MKTVIFKDKKIILSLIQRAIKWHIGYLFLKKSSPLACGLYITSRCNFRCSFCNIWRKTTAATLPLSKVKNIVDDLSGLGCFYLSITGGEPLLVDYLFDLLTYARKSRIKYIHMVTNGYFLDEDAASRLNATGINEVSISIDGSEAVHDRNRVAPGSYRKAIKAIENLKNYAPRTKIVLNAILSPENPFECLCTVELARRFDIYAKVQPLNQHPVFNSANSSLISFNKISPKDIKSVITTLRKDKRVINSAVFLDNIYTFFHNKENLIFKNTPCIFGYHHVEILEDGSVFPCLEGLNWKDGMSFNNGLKYLFDSSEYRQILEKLKKCRGCMRNYYICYYEPRIVFPINNLLRNMRVI